MNNNTMKVWALVLMYLDGDDFVTEAVEGLFTTYQGAEAAMKKNNGRTLQMYDSDTIRKLEREGIKCYIIEEMEVQE